MSESKSKIYPRVLEYRKNVKQLAIFTKIAMLLAGLSFIYSIIDVSLLQSANLHLSAKIVYVAGAFFFALLFACLHYFTFRPLSQTTLQVFEDRLLFNYAGVESEFFFQDLKHVHFGMNGLHLFDKDNKRQSFKPWLLFRVDYIFDAIVEFNPDLVEDKDFDKTRLKILKLDHQVSRTQSLSNVKLWTYGLGIGVLLPLVLSWFTLLLQKRSLLIHSESFYLNATFLRIYPATCLLFVVFYLIIERKISTNLDMRIKDPSWRKRRDLEFEKKWYRLLAPGIICFQFLLMVGIYSFDINMIGIRGIQGPKEKLAYLGVESDKKFWVDYRYNCFSCRLQLQVGDVVLLRGNYVGRVVAVPGQTVVVNDQDMSGRYIASLSEVNVDQGKFAVMTNGGKLVLLKSQNIIRGKYTLDFPL